MLSRKGSCAGGMMSAAAGVDRSRVGERLQAALAGLQELHLLKDRQGDMVSWALRMDRQEPVTSAHAGPEAARAVMGAEEQRLEATLTALKQQLVGRKSYNLNKHTLLKQSRENSPLIFCMCSNLMSTWDFCFYYRLVVIYKDGIKNWFNCPWVTRSFAVSWCPCALHSSIITRHTFMLSAGR